MPRSERAAALGHALVAWGVVPLATLGAGALLLEVALRFLPVNEGCRTAPVNAQQPIITCEPDRTFTWSRFPDFSMTNRVRSNNLGFINDQDYTADSPLPLVAVIGDSMVEALMVPYADTLHGRMARALEGRARVYSFAASGAQLAQYLAYASWVRDRYRPAAVVFVVAPNDFDASLRRRADAPGFHYFAEAAAAGFALERVDFDPGPSRAIVRRSRLLLYLAINVEIDRQIARLRGRLPEPGEAAGGDASDDARLHDSRLAAALFLDRVVADAGVPVERIALVMDAGRPIPRTHAEAEARRTSQAHDEVIRREFLAEARARGFTALDAVEVFLDGAGDAAPAMEFPHDSHWTGTAHGRVAAALLATPVLAGADTR
jgi:hypothetical protein